jgi:putative PIN family toxin of toxin-antitoxin system
MSIQTAIEKFNGKIAWTTPIRLVLDTNVVLDWLVFDDPFMSALRAGVRDRRIDLLTHQPAIDELRRVLGYKQLKLDAARQAEVLAEYQTNTTIESLPQDFSLERLLLPPGFPRCRDPDDEHFLALAFHTHADALISRDKEVLALRKRAEKFALKILDVQQMIALLNRDDA